MNAADREEIRGLSYRYALALDLRRIDDLMKVWAPTDPVFDPTAFGAEAVSGTDSLRAYFSTSMNNTVHSVHLVTNHLVSAVSDDEATGTCYYLWRGVTADGTSMSTIGYYEDAYARSSDGWRLQSRVVIPLMPPELG